MGYVHVDPPDLVILSPNDPNFLRVRPETSRWIAELSEHEADYGEAHERDRLSVELLPILSDPSSARRTRAGPRTPPVFRAFHALAGDAGGRRPGFPLRSFAPLLIQRVVQSLRCGVICPQIEGVVDRGLRRQVFREPAPLTAGRE